MAKLYHITLETSSANVRIYEADEDLVARCNESENINETFSDYDDEMESDYSCELDLISRHDSGVLTILDEDNNEVFRTDNLADIPFKSDDNTADPLDEGTFLVRTAHMENALLEGEMKIEGPFDPSKLYFSIDNTLLCMPYLDESPLAHPRNLMYEGLDDPNYCGLDYMDDDGCCGSDICLLEHHGDNSWTTIISAEE